MNEWIDKSKHLKLGKKDKCHSEECYFVFSSL